MASQFLTLDDLSGTLRTAANPYRLGLNETPACQNFYWLDRVGGRIQRLGSRAFNDTGLATAAFQGFFRFYPSGATAQFIAAINGKIHRGSTAAEMATPLTTAMSTTSAQTYFAAYNDTVYFCNGNSTDKLMSCTKTGDLSKDVASNNAAPYLLCMWANRLWLVTDDDLVQCSDLGAPTTFGTAACWNYTVGKNDNQNITAIVGYRNYLLIFKLTHIYVVTGVGPADFSLQVLTDSVGCDSPRSIIEINDVLYFHDAAGVHTLHGLTLDYRKDGSNTPLTDPVSDIMRDISSTYGPKVACGRFKNFLKISYQDPDQTGAYNNNELLIDAKTERIMCTCPGRNVGMYVTCDGSGDAGEIYYAASDTSGKIYRQEIGTNDGQAADGTGGVAVEAYWRSRPFSPSFPFIAHLLRAFVEAYTGGSEITVKVYSGTSDVAGCVDSEAIAFTGGGREYFVEADGSEPETLEWDEDFFAEVAWDVKEYVMTNASQGASVAIEVYHKAAGYRAEVRRIALELDKGEHTL